MHRTFTMTVVGIATVAIQLGCVSAVPADRGLAIVGGDHATCRPLGPARAIANGWRPSRVSAIATDHEVTLGFFQMPRSGMAVSVDPWELTISREARQNLGFPPARVVSQFDEGGGVSIEPRPVERREVTAVGENATIVAWQGRDAIEWRVQFADGRIASRSVAVSSPEVAVEGPSVISLSDGRFAIAFVHVHASGRAAMILTLDRDGRPLGDPTALWPDGDAFEPRIARAGDGRAMVAFFDGAGSLRGVAVACGAMR